MIGSTLKFVTEQLNQFICNRQQLDPPAKKIVLSSLVAPDGSIAIEEENILVLSLINIGKDAVAYRPAPESRFTPGGSGATYAKESPPIHLNLEILIAANFRPEQLQSGLDLLTLAIEFLHGTPYWNAQKFPEFPPGLSDLAFEMETLDFDQQGHLWRAIGSNYLPSVVYKIRLIILDDAEIDGVVPAIGQVGPPN